MSVAEIPCQMNHPNSERPKRVSGMLLLFLGSLLVYHANGRSHGTVDTIAAPYTAWSLVRHGSLDLRANANLQPYVGTQIRELPNGPWVDIRPLGSALFAVPFVAPSALLFDQPPRPTNMNHLGKLAAAVSAAGASVLFFLVCRRLVPTAAMPATVLFAFGTCLWSVASQALWMHGPATFWLCLALYFLVPAGEKLNATRGICAGLALGLAVFTRPTAAFFGVATGLALITQRRWRGLVELALGAAIPLSAFVWLNNQYFGDPIHGGYGAHDSFAMPTPLWIGLSGLLAAPSRGLLVYTPPLLLLPFGVWQLSRRPNSAEDTWPRILLRWWAIAVAATLIFYAKWHEWAGGWCYGPRFLCETLPVCCLLFGFAYASLAKRWMKHLAVLLVAMAVVIQLIGVMGHGAEDEWCGRHDGSREGRCFFSVHDTQIAAYSQAALHSVAKHFKALHGHSR